LPVKRGKKRERRKEKGFLWFLFRRSRNIREIDNQKNNLEDEKLPGQMVWKKKRGKGETRESEGAGGIQEAN